jgi:leucyl-tRNA synthetase
VQRIWRLMEEALGAMPPAGTPVPDIDGAALALRRATHKTIAGVTADIEGFAFNKAVARLYEFTNALARADRTAPGMGAALREGFEAYAALCAPFTPHLAEAMAQALGQGRMVVETPWPEADADLARDDVIRLAVQVNGKKRAEIAVAPDADTATVEGAALADPDVVRVLAGARPKRVIVVPGRIVNVVV